MKYVFCWILVVLLSSLTFAQDSDVISELKDLTQRQIEASEAEDLEAIELTFHPETPILGQTLMMLGQMAEVYDLEYSLGEHWNYIGQDDVYAYARIEHETRKLDGPTFQDNVVDQIWVFKQFEGEWRVWTSAILAVDYFMPPIGGDSGRRSTYRSANLIFFLTDTQIVDCETKEEFSSWLANPKAECAVTKIEWKDWEEIAKLELALAIDNQLSPENWIETDTGKYVIYPDEDEGMSFKLTYLQGGFIVIEPSAE